MLINVRSTSVKDFFGYTVDAALLSILWVSNSIMGFFSEMYDHISVYETLIKFIGTTLIVITAYFRLRREIRKWRAGK